MEAPDTVEALRQFLLADTDVADLIGTRAFGGPLPRDEAAQMPRYALRVNRAGGLQVFGQGYNEFSDYRFDVRCYGATAPEADRLFRRVQPALKHLRRQVVSGCLLHWAKSAGGPYPLVDPDAGWPMVVSSWQVLVAEVPVS